MTSDGGVVDPTTADEPDYQPLEASEYTQPDDRELAALRHRASLPDIPGISYRCPAVIGQAD